MAFPLVRPGAAWWACDAAAGNPSRVPGILWNKIGGEERMPVSSLYDGQVMCYLNFCVKYLFLRQTPQEDREIWDSVPRQCGGWGGIGG